MLWVAVGRLPLRELCGAGRKPDTCDMEPEPEHGELPGRSLPCLSKCRGIELLHALHVRNVGRKDASPCRDEEQRKKKKTPLFALPQFLFPPRQACLFPRREKKFDGFAPRIRRVHQLNKATEKKEARFYDKLTGGTMREQKALALALVSLLLFSLGPVSVQAQADAEPWESNQTYQLLQRCRNLDDALRLLSQPLILTLLWGGEVEEVEDQADADFGNYDIYTEEGDGGSISEVIFKNKEGGWYKVTGVNRNPVPASEIRKLLEEKDLMGESNTLQQMIAQTSEFADDYWNCLSDQVLGQSLDDLKERLEKLKNDPDLLTVIGLAVPELETLLNDFNDGELDSSSWKKLKEIGLKIGEKAGKKLLKGTKWVKIVPIAGQIAGFFCDAAIQQMENKEQREKFWAIDKWIHIRMGLKGYADEVGDLTQERWEENYEDFWENNNETYGTKGSKIRQKNKDSAKKSADDALSNDLKGEIDKIKNEKYDENNPYNESLTALHFWIAFQINGKRAEHALSYDPERVEVEDYLMHGEPYPVII
jgi:hypothetical protein